MPEPQPYPPISDYALVSDMHSCALVSKAGSIDWCCFPRFDSGSIFGRILDWQSGGHFQVDLKGGRFAARRYLPNTNILETKFDTDAGSASLTDFMPTHEHPASEHVHGYHRLRQICRVLECTRGSVEFTMVCAPRFDYGYIVPHVEIHDEHSGYAHGGSHALSFYCSSPLEQAETAFRSEGALQEGEKLYVVLTYEAPFPVGLRVFSDHPTHRLDPRQFEERLEQTREFWESWAEQCQYDGEYRDVVLRSALTLKALTYAPSGAIMAAATTSLPEAIGGPRNWDYRYTWIRDAALALRALFSLGYHQEGVDFANWVLWCAEGLPQDLQVIYDLAGERRLTEIELDQLEGYRRSSPVRIGNGASRQFQLDIYGELLDAMHVYRQFMGTPPHGILPDVEQPLLEFVMDNWREPDEGIWETRGGRQHFVFSKVMCWVALDRALKYASEGAMTEALMARIEETRDEIRREVLSKGYSEDHGTFVQSYGSSHPDASLLLLPLVGFIAADDPRMESTIRMIERELTSPKGFVYRYRDFDDGLSGEEGTFLICTFWLANNYIALGEIERARNLFEKLVRCANDVGLLSEEFDGETGQMLGNFPQAFSHLGLISTAVRLKDALSD
jgi:GH15 family glucan-1,4-alpha-glucosidase